MESVGELLARTHADLLISKRSCAKPRASQSSAAKRVATDRAYTTDRSSSAACRYAGRRVINSLRAPQRQLRAAGERAPEFGLPFGQTACSIFRRPWPSSGARQHRFRPIMLLGVRFVQRQWNIVGWWRRSNASRCTIFFGSDTSRPRPLGTPRPVQLSARSAYLKTAVATEPLENVVVLSEEFYAEALAHPIPADLDAVRVLASAPAALDLFLWLT
jgi:hypothetical protein